MNASYFGEGEKRMKGLSEEDSLAGPAYVTCWIDKDYNAEGKLSIPSFADGQTVIFYLGPVGPMKE